MNKIKTKTIKKVGAIAAAAVIILAVAAVAVVDELRAKNNN